ncbi:MAG: epoxyqueuosine reductase QueH [Treponema sp.]|nr:epoxyqueuosine reductase QueH [Treponema sp.]
MSKNDYQKQLDTLLQNLEGKPSLLLHACCGPCSSYVLEYLSSHFDITVLFYNPNIYPQAEYQRRLQELLNFYTRFVPAENVRVIQAPYEPEEFYTAVGTRENPELAKEPERGERCRRCYELRLRYTYNYACEHGFDYFCTTLSISPFKDAQMINELGEQLGGGTTVVPEALEGPNKKTPRWLPSDFKKKNGFKRSLELSAEYDLYRQEYCGCIYSI